MNRGIVLIGMGFFFGATIILWKLIKIVKEKIKKNYESKMSEEVLGRLK